MALDHPPEPGVLNGQHRGGFAHRHMTEQEHGQGLQKQRKTAAGPSPRHFDLTNLSVGSFYPWHPRNELRAELEEIEVLPAPFDGVMHGQFKLLVEPGGSKFTAAHKTNMHAQESLLAPQFTLLHPPLLSEM